jgi:hypothetical protein
MNAEKTDSRGQASSEHVKRLNPSLKLAERRASHAPLVLSNAKRCYWRNYECNSLIKAEKRRHAASFVTLTTCPARARRLDWIFELLPIKYSAYYILMIFEVILQSPDLASDVPEVQLI